MTYPSFEHLETLVAVAESRNLVEAAKRLGISQPSVSMKLKLLEASVPLPLFQFEGKSKKLTRYGRELYELGNKQIKDLSLAFEGLNRSYASAKHLLLRVGCRPELFEYFSPQFVFGGSVEFHPSSSADAVEALLSHRIDMAISWSKPDSADIVARKILRSGCSFVIHPRLLKKIKSVEKASRDSSFLKETPSLTYQPDGHLLREWVESVGPKFSELNINIIAQSWNTLLRLVEHGLGYSVIPDHVASRGNGILIFDLPSKVVPIFEFYLLFRKDMLQVAPFKAMLSKFISVDRT